MKEISDLKKQLLAAKSDVEKNAIMDKIISISNSRGYKRGVKSNKNSKK